MLTGEPTVIKVQNKQLSNGFGTGFFINKNIIITCAHCLYGLQDNVQVAIEGKSLTAKIKKVDSALDLALLEVDEPSLTPDTAIFTTRCEKRDEVSVVGFNQYMNCVVEQIGVVQDTGAEKDFIAFNGSKIIDGYSGSPLINDENNLVIGVVNRSFSKDYPEGGIAVSHSRINEFCKSVGIELQYKLNFIEEHNKSLRRIIEEPINQVKLFDRALQKKNGDLLLFDDFINNNFTKLNIIFGIGGLGKSYLLKRLCLRLMGLYKNSFSIFCDAKEWDNNYSEDIQNTIPFSTRIDNLLAGFNSKLYVEKLHQENIDNENKALNKFFFLDGLNEFGDEKLRNNIIKALYELNKQFGFIVFVTSRGKEKEYREWEFFEIQKIDGAILDEILFQAFGKRANDYDPKTLEYLKLPFFLNISFKTKKEDITSYSDFISEHTLKTVPHEDRETVSTLLSEAAFKSYTTNQKLFISKSDVEAFPKEFAIDINILKPKGDGFEFEHHLIHDYFVAHKISSEPDKWNVQTFDIITFGIKRSFQIMQMILEQIPAPELGEKFLKSLYDWNFYATLECLKYVDNKYSDQFARALILILTEKITDPFRHTRKKVIKHLLKLFEKFHIKGIPDRFDESAILNLRETEATRVFKKIIKLNGEYFSQGNYADWYRLFSLDSGEADESLINDILDDDPIKGWCCANVVRRFTFTDKNELQLRSLLRAEKNSIIRWRIIHAMGRCKEPESISFLFSIIQVNEYKWATYGAIRSLVEIAFFNIVDNHNTESILRKIVQILVNIDDEDIKNEFRDCLNTKIERSKAEVVDILFNQTIIPNFPDEVEWTKTYEQFRSVNDIE